ncbi:MAG TPA: vanadium-dependent haloperoxidase [Thermoanaerobaculia bacterium]|nr:vanadium-dependent haloperoxidase [Thermoanaerobaculia bacterium]
MRKPVVVLVFVVSLAAAGAARAEAVADLNAIASQIISSGGRPGPSTLVDFAVVHAAIHDAVQATDRRYKPYHVTIDGASGSPVAAAARAARDVLVDRFPAQIASIDSRYLGFLVANGVAADDPGIAVGARAAAGIIALRAGDGAFPAGPQVPFTGSGETGAWRPTPSYLAGAPAGFSPMAAPWLANVTPFAVKSPSQFRAKTPPALTSDEYTRDFNEVKALGGAFGTGSRTQEQTEAGYFWSDNTPLQWHRALRAVANAYVDNIGDSARLFALASFAAADGIMTCWETKLHYNYWRPVTAIHEAADDGNPDTQPDPSWKPLLNTPNYPDYSSGANTVTAAMTRTMELFFGTDEKTFTVTSNSANLPLDRRMRTFARFSDAASEVVEARIYLGYHFRFADTAGREAGERVAKWTFTHVLKPLDKSDVE